MKWGDVDCRGNVDAVDVLKVLRYVAGLEVQQREPCPDIGSTVTVDDVPFQGLVTPSRLWGESPHKRAENARQTGLMLSLNMKTFLGVGFAGSKVAAGVADPAGPL